MLCACAIVCTVQCTLFRVYSMTGLDKYFFRIFYSRQGCLFNLFSPVTIHLFHWITISYTHTHTHSALHCETTDLNEIQQNIDHRKHEAWNLKEHIDNNKIDSFPFHSHRHFIILVYDIIPWVMNVACAQYDFVRCRWWFSWFRKTERRPLAQHSSQELKVVVFFFAKEATDRPHFDIEPFCRDAVENQCIFRFLHVYSVSVIHFSCALRKVRKQRPHLAQ